MDAKVILITGCFRGIGQGMALHFAKDPQRRFKVYATMMDLAAGEKDIKSKAGSTFGDTLFTAEIDVTKQDTIDKTVKDIIEKEGRIDVLVNNAGIARPTWWITAPMETFYDLIEVNYYGCVRMTKAVVPHMKAQRSGKIIQFSSVLGFKPLPASEQYVASKFALEGFSECIAPPLRKYNIWVSLIEPGYVATEITKPFGSNPRDMWISMAGDIPDDKDREIVQRMIGSADQEICMGAQRQTIADISNLVENVITSAKPNLRYQTSEAVQRQASRRFVDPTGNAAIDAFDNV